MVRNMMVLQRGHRCLYPRIQQAMTMMSLSQTTKQMSSSSSSSSSVSMKDDDSIRNNKAYIQGDKTHFGFEDVSISEKEGRVREVFESVAESYDVMNDLMSGGLHRYWKDELLAMTGVEGMARVIRRHQFSKSTTTDNNNNNPKLSLGLSILDVAGGTGDVSFRFLEAAGCQERAKSSGKDEVSITVCDINSEMLRVGEKRAKERYGTNVLHSGALQFVQGNAQSLPFQDDQYDIYTIAFGLRNVTDVDMALRDAYRVLKPGGRYLCLEFSHVTNPIFRSLYDTFSFHAIPTMGEVVANDRASYQYLVESIRKFSNQDELQRRMEDAGFVGCKYTNMTGGIVAVHEGWKPL